jgi:putative phosphoesterase
MTENALCLAVLSDVHGNLPALQAVSNDMQQYSVDGIIVAGDFIGGPQPNETIELLRSLGSCMIRGNSDNNLLRYESHDLPDAWRNDLQFALLRWAFRHVTQENLQFLRSLPEQRVIELPGAAAIRAVHGSPRHPAEAIYPDRDPALLDLVLGQVDEPVLVCGHTHEPWALAQNGKLALNPGAVCGPLNGYVGAQYALLTWQPDHWQVEHRALPYDIDQIRSAFHASGLWEEGGTLAHLFLRSIETGQNVTEDFLSYAYSLAAQHGFRNCEYIPDIIWERATATFDTHGG